VVPLVFREKRPTFPGMKALGLELKAGKAVVDMIIIDEVSRPTPN
jgi:uncharacterized protein (TIGR03435 family)